MPRFPRFLDRFRRLIAPPGRPSEAVGVPASGDDLEGELRPLLERLETIGAEADRVVMEARDVADRRRERARADAHAIVQEAAEGAEAERARAASRRRGSAPGGPSPAAPAGRASEPAALRDARVDDLVAEVLECVRRSGL